MSLTGNTPNAIAIIPARGGSKRIPRKNIRNFAGRGPILAMTIGALKDADLFSGIYVSTEDETIASVAHHEGAKVIQRPEHLADDHTTTGQVMQHAVAHIVDNGANHVACIYPTAALISIPHLREGLQKLITETTCYTFSVARHRAPIERALRIDRDTGRLIPPKASVIDSRNQDHPATYYDAGQWYWGLRNAWLNGLAVYHPGSFPIVVPPWSAIDIDTEEDWQLAELVYRGIASMIQAPTPDSPLPMPTGAPA